MPIIEELIYAALSGDATLSTLVGGRISSAKTLLSTDYPCVTFHQIHGDVEYTHDGPVETLQDLWQFDAWSMDYDTMRSVKRAIRDALHAASTFTALLSQDLDLYEDKTRVYHGLRDAHIWWKNASGITVDDVTNMDDVTDMDTLEEAA